MFEMEQTMQATLDVLNHRALKPCATLEEWLRIHHPPVIRARNERSAQIRASLQDGTSPETRRIIQIIMRAVKTGPMSPYWPLVPLGTETFGAAPLPPVTHPSWPAYVSELVKNQAALRIMHEALCAIDNYVIKPGQPELRPSVAKALSLAGATKAVALTGRICVDTPDLEAFQKALVKDKILLDLVPYIDVATPKTPGTGSHGGQGDCGSQGTEPGTGPSVE